MRVGCHISISEGIEKAPEMANILGCEVMQIFTRPPQGGPATPIGEDTIKKFISECRKYNIEEIYIHAPYFINLASTNNKIKYGSISTVKTELERASLLKAKYVMTHLGSANDLNEKKAVKETIESLRKILDGYNETAKLLIENSAGAGNIIGDDFEEIGKILDALKGYPSLAGICLDTQHAFASGYDWVRDSNKNMKLLGKYIGLHRIKLIHANDSATDLGSHKDRHEHIGKGKIGLSGFIKIAEIFKLININMVCETDYPGVIEDIKLLKSLR